MSSHNRAAHWNEVYATKAPNQVSWFQAEPVQSLRMIAASGAHQDAAIIDIGGGASVLVDRLLAAGFTDVSLLDIAENALERSITRLGQAAAKVNWIVADVLSWTPQRRYDVWHDRAVFHFLTEERDRVAYRNVLSLGLKPGGSLIVATFAADGPERCSGLKVRRWSSDELAREFPGFEMVETGREEHSTPGGAVQPFGWTRFERT